MLNPEGFHVYRREIGNNQWDRLNTTPVKKQSGVSKQLLLEDEELDFFVDLVNNHPEDLKEEFLFFNLLLKSFQSNDLSNFLGIYFEDHTAVVDKKYEYRVTIIDGQNEKRLNQSGSILAGEYQPEPSVKGVEVFQEKNYIAINWEQDELRFYAVNIYSIDSEDRKKKLNTEPVMLSMVPDSTGALRYPRPMYKASGFKENESFSFYLEGMDYFGEATLPTDQVKLTFDDTTPPPVPTELQGTADSLKVILKWEMEEVRDLKGFNIYRSNTSEGEFSKINTSTLEMEVRSYEEILKVPGPYYYRVEAIDHANNVSRSKSAFVEAQDVFPPDQPQGLTIESDTGEFILRWHPNTEPDLLGYYVYRTIDGNTSDDFLLMNAEPLDSNVFVQKLPKAVRNNFFYYLVAVDTSFNRSKPSAFATAVLPDVTPPEQPFIERINYLPEGISVEWTQNVEPDLAGYTVFRSDSSGIAGEKVNLSLLPPYSFKYTDRSANTNKGYFYTIEALDISGNISLRSSEAFANWYEEPIINEALTLRIKSKKRRQSTRLEWNTIPSQEIKGYVVFRGTSERVIKPITGVIKSQNTYTDKVEKNTDYYYQVRAYADTGQVIYSETISYNVN